LQDYSLLPRFLAWIRKRRKNFAMVLLLRRRTRLCTLGLLSKLPRSSPGMVLGTDEVSLIAIGRKPDEE
jgi:hypothetical protein